MNKNPLAQNIEKIIELALEEDIRKGDITSNLTISKDAVSEFVINAREDMVICGVDIAKLAFLKISNDIEIKIYKEDGSFVKAGEDILYGKGNSLAILAAERVALNFLRQLSGVANLTAKFVDKVKDTKVKILDTRKTIPLLRSLQKKAVLAGGGYNHRFCLDDAILIKDNHILASGGIKNALLKAKLAPKGIKIEVECDTIEQVKEVLKYGADQILLDNMSLEQLREAVKITDSKIALEASGNVNLKTVRDIALTGVDFISIGALTNNPDNIDIGLDILN